jgi:hypothetical protein
MKLLTIASTWVILFFYVAFLPLAFVVSCFKLALSRTDVALNKWADRVEQTLERRKK